MRNLFVLLLGLVSPVLWAQPAGSFLVGTVPLDSLDAVYVEIELTPNPYGEGFLVMVLYGQECEDRIRVFPSKEERIKYLIGCSGLREAGGTMPAVSGVAELANLMHRLGWAYVELVPWRPRDAQNIIVKDLEHPGWSFYLFRRRDL